MSKIIVPNYTQVPNVVIDDLAAKLSDSAFKIYVVLIRKTKGWEQKRDAIAISQFCELTGKSKPTVIKALDELCNLALIKKTRFTKYGNEYELNLSFSHDGVFVKFTSKKSLLVKKFDIKSKEILLLKVKKFDTQQTLSKDTIKNTNINKGEKAEVKKFDTEKFDSDISNVFSFWKSVFNKADRTKLEGKRLTAIKARLKEGYSADEIKTAIRNVSKSQWHIDNGQTDIELICRNQINLDKYLALKPFTQQGNYQQPQNTRMQEIQQLSQEWELNNESNYTPY